MVDAELKLLLEELLAPLGPVVLKRMFGGYGVFLDGLMFGLVSDDQLYFKTSEASRAAFQAEGLGPFTYTKKGAAAVLTSYWQAPDRLLDDSDELVEWARTAQRCAVAAKVKKPARKSPKATPRAKTS
jgi:DNA transformation protein